MENQADALNVGSKTPQFSPGRLETAIGGMAFSYDVQKTNEKANILLNFEISGLLRPPLSSDIVFLMALGQLLSLFTSASQLVKWELL